MAIKAEVLNTLREQEGVLKEAIKYLEGQGSIRLEVKAPKADSLDRVLEFEDEYGDARLLADLRPSLIVAMKKELASVKAAIKAG